jgi:ornithine carbamoyltransferase
MKHFINLDDFNSRELNTIIEHAITLKKEHNKGVVNNSLQHKTLAMIFDKSSTRTRVSFEAGTTQLGGHSVFLSSSDTQLGRGEPISDSARVISSMVDMIMLRISSHSDIEEFAKYSSVPVINALTDESHPCQLLADIMTFRELKGDITGKTLCYIGDGNNMANTYAQAAKVFDFKLNIASPQEYSLDNKYNNDNVELFTNTLLAAQNADAIITDVWASMGQEEEQNKRAIAFKDFQVTTEVLEQAKNDAIFMHCLPAHRGEEVSVEVIDGSQSVIYQEAENRLHAQKALMLYLHAHR